MIKKILLGLIAALLIFIVFLAIVNLSNPKDEIPSVSIEYGAEPNLSDREWWESTTVYQIYPRSFQDSNDDGVGDLAGIISRLDYIKDLGFETIWFSPFFNSPQKDFGYDVSDYILPDPDYGDSLLVDSLIKEIHAREMKVVFDLVLNHTSEEHPWFIESRSSRNNPKSDWYIWKDGNGDEPPNNWHSALGMNGWHYDSTREQWYFSSFLEFQPDLNWRKPEVKSAMFDVVRYWLDKGVDGFRLDIFNYIYEDESFNDNPFTFRFLPTQDLSKMLWQHKKYTMNHPDDFALAKELRSILDEYTPSRFTVGEVFGDNATLKNFLGKNNDGLNLIFLFDISQIQWNAEFFSEHIKEYEAYYPYPYLPTYVFSNHDKSRSMAYLDNDPQKAKTLALMQLTLRGVPFFYYGEEIGMSNGDIPIDEALDPLPHAFSWLPDFLKGMIFNRDNYRTPMQWSPQQNAGFSSPDSNPWLPTLAGSDSINVEIQLSNEKSQLNNLKQLLRIRETNPEIKWGSLKLNDSDPSILSFERIYRDQKAKIHINFSDSPKEVEIETEAKILYSSGDSSVEDGYLIIGPNTGVIIK